MTCWDPGRTAAPQRVEAGAAATQGARTSRWKNMAPVSRTARRTSDKASAPTERLPQTPDVRQNRGFRTLGQLLRQAGHVGRGRVRLIERLHDLEVPMNALEWARPVPDEQKLEQFVGRVLADLGGAMIAPLVRIG